MGTNPVRVCELVVGLPDVAVLGVDDDGDGPLRIHVEACLGRPTYPCCRGVVRWKDRNRVVLMDLPTAGTVGAAGVAQTTVGMPRRGVSGRVVHRPGVPDRSGPRRDDRPGRPVGEPCRSAGGAAPFPRSPASSGAIGIPSTTPWSPTGRSSSMTQIGSDRSVPWGWTKPCFSRKGRGTLNGGPPRS